MPEKPSLISISDVFGLGKVASSAAATRLVDAVIAGVGELFFPWRLRRNVAAQIEAAKQLDANLPVALNANIELDARTAARVNLSQVRNQINRESIATLAIESLRDEPSVSEGIEDKTERIEGDWVEYFWEKAQSVSDESMQGLWARVLMRKAIGHGISLRTLDLLRTLSVEEARVIEQLSQFRIAFGPDHRFLRNTIGLLFYPEINLKMDERPKPDRIIVQGNRVISKDGEPVEHRCSDLIGNPYTHILEPAGIYTDTSRAHDFALNWNTEPLPVQIGDGHFRIVGLPGRGSDGYEAVSFGTGIGFSQVGWEIFSFAKSAPNPEFVNVLREILKKRGLELETST